MFIAAAQSSSLIGSVGFEMGQWASEDEVRGFPHGKLFTFIWLPGLCDPLVTVHTPSSGPNHC